MTAFWKIMICAAFVGVSLTTLSACNDEDNDERDTPAVYEVVSDMYDSFKKDANFNSKMDCFNIKGILVQFNKEKVGGACDEYNTRRNDNGGYDSLATKKTNSGLYQAAFILADQLHEKAKSCNESHEVKVENLKQQFRELSDNKCEQFLQDAKDFTTKRGK